MPAPRPALRSVLLLLFLVPVPAGCRTAPPDPAARGPIRVSGDVRYPTAWTAERLDERFGSRVRVVRHVTKGGDEHPLRAVALADLIAESEPALDPDRKNAELAVAVVARARDGYTVTYSYDEVVPYRGEPTLFLAFAEEDGPLPERLGPARIVSLAEMSSSRSPRAVDEIEVVDLAPRSTEVR